MEKAGLQVVDERGVVYSRSPTAGQLSTDMDVNYMLSAARERMLEAKSYPPCPRRAIMNLDRVREPVMIVELVTFTFPKGHDRASELEAVRSVIPKWAANQELVRKHFLWGIGEDEGTGAGFYIWPSIEAAKNARITTNGARA